MSVGFNPIKEDKEGKVNKIVWSSETIHKAINGINEGKKLISNPFYENKTYLLKGDITFKHTEEEIEEWLKCKNDIVYFANKWCKLMTPEGIKNIILRDYQIKYLKHLVDNRLSIMLSSRQSGKCNSFISNILVKIDWDKFTSLGVKLKKYFDKNYYSYEMDCYEIPFFELYNLYDKSLKWKLQYFLYKQIYKHERKFCYKILSLLNTENDDKILKSFQTENIRILNDNGFHPITHIHQTKPFTIYKLILENGLELDCADEHIVFCDNHIQKFVKDLTVNDMVITRFGLSKVKQVIKTDTKLNMVDVTVDDISHSYYSNNILSHNTTTSAIFLLHFILFNIDKNALVTGNKLKTSVEIIDKIKSIFESLPHFLKPGIYKWNQTEIALDNGCRCMGEATTGKSGIGFTFHVVLADEFAHIAPNIKNSFYENLFPVVTAGRARFMITSTQNGAELFCQLYQGAVNGENEYAPFKVDWYDVPEWNPDTKTWEKRDDEWHRKQVGNLGGEEAFQMQYGTEFTVGSDALISNKFIIKESVSSNNFINKDLPGVVGCDCFFWDPDYNIEDLRNDFFICTTDISEGINQDSTVQTFNKIIGVDDDNSPITKTIGYFKTNSKQDKECCEILSNFYNLYFNPSHYLISMEYNIFGELWYSNFKNLIDKYHYDNFSEDNFIKFYNENMSRYYIGVKMTSKSKRMACKLFKSDYETGMIINRSAQFLNELRCFVDKNGNGSYEANFGHDDMVMSQIQLTLAKNTIQVKYLVDEFIANQGSSSSNGNINFYEEISDNIIYNEYGSKFTMSDIFGASDNIYNF